EDPKIVSLPQRARIEAQIELRKWRSRLKQVDLRGEIVVLGHLQLEMVGNAGVKKQPDEVAYPSAEQLRPELLDRTAVLELQTDISRMQVDPMLSQIFFRCEPTARRVKNCLPCLASDLLYDRIGRNAGKILWQRMDSAAGAGQSDDRRA